MLKTVQIKNEYIKAQLDESVISQVFEVISENKNLLKLKHETGLIVDVPEKYVIEV